MIREGITFEETGIPICLKTTQARLDVSSERISETFKCKFQVS
jgi:hypothetical protein